MRKGQLTVTTTVEYNGLKLAFSETENCGNPLFAARSVRIITDRLRTQLSAAIAGVNGDADTIRNDVRRDIGHG